MAPIQRRAKNSASHNWIPKIRPAPITLGILELNSNPISENTDSIPWRTLAYALIVYVIMFLLSLAIGHRMNIPFYYLQLLDEVHLRDRFWESIYYLHSQPPLLNFTLGLLMKAARLAGVSVETMAMGMNFFLGAVAVAGWTLMVSSLIPRGRLFKVCLGVLLLHPVFYASIFHFFYTFHETFFLALIPFFVHRYVRYGQVRYFAGACLLIVGLTYTRSLFHFVWSMAGIAGLLWLGPSSPIAPSPHRRRNLAFCMAFAWLLLLSWPLKNFAQFGVFGYSSWAGFNFAQGLSWNIDDRVPDINGLYKAEDWGGVKVRWTSGSIEVGVQKEIGALQISYLVGHPEVSPDRPVTVSISAGGSSGVSVEHNSGGFFTQEIRIPPEAPDPIPIRIGVEPLWVSPESRKLGVGLYPLQWVDESGSHPAEEIPLPVITHNVPIQFRGVPILTQRAKSNGARNGNHYFTIEDARARSEFALRSIKSAPWNLFPTAYHFYWCYSRGAGRHPYLGHLGFDPVEPTGAIRTWMRLYEIVLLQEFRDSNVLAMPRVERSDPHGWAVTGFPFTLPLLLIAAIFTIIRRWKTDAPSAKVAAFMLYCIVWVLSMVIFVDGNEGNRMRFSTEPYLIVLAFWTLSRSHESLGSGGTRQEDRADENQPQ